MPPWVRQLTSNCYTEVCFEGTGERLQLSHVNVSAMQIGFTPLAHMLMAMQLCSKAGFNQIQNWPLKQFSICNKLPSDKTTTAEQAKLQQENMIIVSRKKVNQSQIHCLLRFPYTQQGQTQNSNFTSSHGKVILEFTFSFLFFGVFLMEEKLALAI